MEVLDIQTYSRPNCIVCGSQGTNIYAELKDQLYGAPGSWKMSKCNNESCSHLWLNPSPIEEDLWKVYRNYYTHDSTGSGLPGYISAFLAPYLSLKSGYPGKFGVFKKMIASSFILNPVERCEFDFAVLSIPFQQGKRILDVGCGNGHFLKRLKNYGWESVGIDFDEKAVNNCKGLGIEAYTGDVRTLNFEESSFDVVTLNHVIEHLSDPEGTLVAIRRLLKPGGQLIIATPNGNSRSRKKFNTNWYAMQAPAHLNLFNRDNLSAFSKHCGYTVVTGKTTSRNEHWIYYVSKMLQKYNQFDFKGRKEYSLVIFGKLYQYWGYVLNLFSGKIGGELFFVLQKD